MEIMMGEKLAQEWSKFTGLIGDSILYLLKEPLVYAVGGLIFVLFVALYNIPRSRHTMKRSLFGLFDYAAKLLIGFIGDLLAAVESITSFIDVVRIILMGKLSEGTQFLLSNYAIVALSIASFITTFNGLTLLMENWAISAFITFGIQVAILALSHKLTAAWIKRQKEALKLVRNVSYHEKIVDIENYFAENKAWKDEDKDEDKDKGNICLCDKDDKKSLWWYVLQGSLLLFAMTVSIFFSYTFLFDKVVYPSVPFENYISTINKVTEISDAYSQAILDYQGVLINELQQYSNKSREILEEYMAGVRAFNSREQQILDQMEEKQSERSELAGRRDSLRAQIAYMEEGEERARAEENLQTIEEELEKLEDDIADLEKEQSDLYEEMPESTVATQEAYNSLNILDGLYADPLYLLGDEEREDTIREAFSNVVQYNANVSDMEENSDISIIFNNYLALCKYYAGNSGSTVNANTYIGLDKSPIDDALDDVEEALREYEETQREAELLRMGNTEKSSETAEAKLAEADADINQKSAGILQAMIGVLEEAPAPEKWKNMSLEAQQAIDGLGKEEILKDIYSYYRVSMGNVDLMEMAVLKLSMGYPVLSLLMLFLAAFIDVLTVILTFTKSKNSYENTLPRYRKIICRIFINDEVSPFERAQIRRRRLAGGIGVMAGLLLFAGYYIAAGCHTTAENRVELFITLVCFVSLPSLIALICVWIYEKMQRDANAWRKEGLYNELVKSWKLPNQEDRDPLSLRGKIQDAVEQKTKVELSDEDMQKLIELLSAEEDTVFMQALKVEARLLFRKIQIRELYKLVLEYQNINDNMSAMKTYKFGWNEKADYAVISIKDVKEQGMDLAFAVLRGEGLIGYVKTFPADYYVLTRKFLRILYDLMMEAASGNSMEAEYYTFADNFWDMYEEEDINEISS